MPSVQTLQVPGEGSLVCCDFQRLIGLVFCISGQTEVLAPDILMAHLLKFLKRHIEWKEPVHPCEWVSLAFIEQDDDMLEVAKCLLKMYQHNPR